MIGFWKTEEERRAAWKSFLYAMFEQKYVFGKEEVVRPMPGEGEVGDYGEELMPTLEDLKFSPRESPYD